MLSVEISKLKFSFFLFFRNVKSERLQLHPKPNQAVLSHPTLIRSSLIWLFHPVLFKNQTLLIRTYVIVPRMPTMLVVQNRIASIGIWWQNASVFADVETSASIRGFRGDSIQLSKSYELPLGDGDCMYFNLSKKVRLFFTIWAAHHIFFHEKLISIFHNFFSN